MAGKSADSDTSGCETILVDASDYESRAVSCKSKKGIRAGHFGRFTRSDFVIQTYLDLGLDDCCRKVDEFG